MSFWLDDLISLGSGQGCTNAEGQDCILVSVVRTQGSCPRNAATRMIVTAERCFGTIGGGHLEFEAIGIAKRLLDSKKSLVHVERFPLSARLGQCCGGVAHLSFEFISCKQPDWVNELHQLHKCGHSAVLVSQLAQAVSLQSMQEKAACVHSDKMIITAQGRTEGRLSKQECEPLASTLAMSLLRSSNGSTTHWQDSLLLEVLPANDFHIAIFGAGHVGKALVNVLGTLSCQIIWIDSRADEFPDNVPDNVRIVCCDHPEDALDDLPEQSYIVVMTHSHALDQAICERALRRSDIAFCGLIGSLTKRRQFKQRMLSRGLTEAQLAGLTCPIGIDGLGGKHPAHIAVSVSAQLLQAYDSYLARVATPEPAQSGDNNVSGHIDHSRLAARST